MAIEIGRVTGSEIVEDRDSPGKVRMLQVELTDTDDIQNVEFMQPCGDNSAPQPGSYALIIDADSAFRFAIGVDTTIEPDAEAGERELFSYDDNFLKLAKLLLDKIGSLILTPSSNGQIELAGSARDASGVGDTITIDATTDPTFFTNFIAPVSALIGLVPPPTSITGKISSGANKVKLP